MKLDLCKENESSEENQSWLHLSVINCLAINLIAVNVQCRKPNFMFQIGDGFNRWH